VLVLAALQLRHSLAASRGARPRYWQWTLLLLLILAYAPLPLFMYRWPTAQWFVIASLAMLLPARAATPAVAAVVIGWGAWSLYDGIVTWGLSTPE